MPHSRKCLLLASALLAAQPQTVLAQSAPLAPGPATNNSAAPSLPAGAEVIGGAMTVAALAVLAKGNGATAGTGAAQSSAAASRNLTGVLAGRSALPPGAQTSNGGGLAPGGSAGLSGAQQPAGSDSDAGSFESLFTVAAGIISFVTCTETAVSGTGTQ